MKLVSRLFALTLGSFATCTPAIADPVYVSPGYYRVVAYVASTATQWNDYGICVSASGTWYNTDQVKGSGRWWAQGSDFVLQGNMLSGGILYNDAAVLRIKGNIMEGFFTQGKDNTIADDSLSNGFFYTVWRRQAQACPPPV
jgi:hypothetical protein